MQAIQIQKLSIVARVAVRVAAILHSKWRADGHCDGCGITRGRMWKGERVTLHTYQMNGDRQDFGQHNLAQLCQQCLAYVEGVTLRRLP